MCIPMIKKKFNMNHVEDLILTNKCEGGQYALQFLEGATEWLSGNSNSNIKITTKWDGAPAVFAGHHPENGKFFVGTKGIFTKSNPKILYTNEDVDIHYGDKEDLANKLKAALLYLPELGIKDIIQGDIMFSREDIKSQTINGKQYVTFQPNTIMYAIPDELSLARTIQSAHLGIIFHTAYTGNTIHTLTSSYDIDVTNLNQPSEVWFDDADYKDKIILTARETNEVKNLIKFTWSLLSHITNQDIESLYFNNTFVGMIQQFVNYRIRNGAQYDHMDSIVHELLAFVELKVHKETTKPETKEKKIGRLHSHIKKFNKTLLKVFYFQQNVVNIKNKLIEKLESSKTIDTFHVADDNIIVAPQEGFVAHHNDNAIKLVNRLSFSRANFARHT